MHVQFAMSSDKLVNWRQVLLRRSKASDHGPNTLATRKPRRTVEPAPVVRRLRQPGLFEHCLCETHIVEIPKRGDEWKQQADPLALVDHQCLMTMTILINHFVRRRVSERE